MPAVREPIDIFKYYDMSAGPDACWPYTGNAWGGRPMDLRPYFMSHGRRQITYRWIYELVHGVTLTPDQLVIHSCDNGNYPIACGNPAHLSLGTAQDNSDDRTKRERHGMPRTVVRAIRTLLEQGRTHREIAELYGVGQGTVGAIAAQRSHRTVD